MGCAHARGLSFAFDFPVVGVTSSYLGGWWLKKSLYISPVAHHEQHLQQGRCDHAVEVLAVLHERFLEGQLQASNYEGNL